MRGKRAKKRPVMPDPVYKSRSLSRLINTVMLDGKKATAETIVYGALEKLSNDKKEALDKYEAAMQNIMPKQEVRSRRVGGATYQVPFPVKHARAEALALRWLVDIARKKKGKPMSTSLFEELESANENAGDAIKMRDDTHKMAEANKAFAHFRF